MGFASAARNISLYPNGSGGWQSNPPSAGAYTLTWGKPANDTAGVALGAGFITGYKIYKKTGGSFALHDTITSGDTLTANVDEGIYAIAATFTNGQTALSDIVNTAHWRLNLPAPDANNTFTALDSQATIQAYLDSLAPGGVLYLSDADGDFSWTNESQGTAFINVSTSTNGTASDYITICNVPGESPVITGNFDGVDLTQTDQRIVRVDGNYIRIAGLTIEKSTRFGIEIRSSFAHIVENIVQDNVDTGILLHYTDADGDGENSDGVIEYNIMRRQRIGAGFSCTASTSTDTFRDRWTVQRNIAYRNGYDDVNTKTGTGNTDGMNFLKTLHENFIPGNALDPANYGGRENLFQYGLIAQNICYRNADDGMDESTGLDTKFIGNISANNGPDGNRGFKTYPDCFEHKDWFGNVAIFNEPVDGAGSGWGFEQNVNLSTGGSYEPTRSAPTNHNIAWTSIHNRDNNLKVESNATGKYYNCLTYGGGGGLTENGTFDKQNNHENTDPAPDINDNAYDTVDEALAGTTVEEMWRNKYREILSKIMPIEDGNLYNNAVNEPLAYHSTAADDSVNPSDPSDFTKIHWFENQKTSPVPDRGAVQYTPVFPPVLAIS